MTRKFLHLALMTSAVAAVACAEPTSLSAQETRGGTARAYGRGNLMDEGPRPQAFSVTLVLGEMQASGSSDNVPPSARKALTDLKDFLPYKSYRLLDTQWTLCCGRGSIMTRLRGPNDQDYSLELNPSAAGGGKWNVHFSLWEPRGAERIEASSSRGGSSSSSVSALEAQRAALERQLAELRKNDTANHPAVIDTQVRIEALERAINDIRRTESTRRTLALATPRRAMIDTSFTMAVGETVVVGTSRLKGDQALIALLTAVAPNKTPGR